MNSSGLVQLAQLGGSIFAVLLVWQLTVRLGLGGDVRIKDERHARELAADALCGFDAVDLVVDRAGIGALLRDTAGRVMLVRRHGAQFAARLLDSHAFTRLDHNFLTIATGETRYGGVTLDLGDKAQIWASSLRHLSS